MKDHPEHDEQHPVSNSDQFDRAVLQQGGAEIQALAAQIDHKLKSLELWLTALPGRVDTQVCIADPENPATQEFNLRFKRGLWRLYCCYTPFGVDPRESDWRAVSSCGLQEKVLATEATPSLLRAMVQAQSQLVSRLRSANATFDQLAASAGIKNEGRK